MTMEMMLGFDSKGLCTKMVCLSTPPPLHHSMLQYFGKEWRYYYLMREITLFFKYCITSRTLYDVRRVSSNCNCCKSQRVPLDFGLCFQLSSNIHVSFWNRAFVNKVRPSTQVLPISEYPPLIIAGCLHFVPDN